MEPTGWIFGYGSLIWRPAFEFAERRVGYVEGFERRFWQGSTDHRGVPEAPGRVVTLVPTSEATCWGVAYRVSPDERDTVFTDLDVREKGGYARSEVTVRVPDSEPLRAVTYMATPENPNYLGPAPLAEIVSQIRRSSGPSGANTEYVLRLAEFLLEVGADEPHALEIARLLEQKR